MNGSEKAQFKLLGMYVNKLDLHDDTVKENIGYPNRIAINYQKVLDEGYFSFDNSFEFDPVNCTFKKTKERIEIFDLSSIKINIHAIVGKNGSGKSSILELLMLMIYNLGIKTKILQPTYRRKGESTINPEYKSYLNASLFYQQNKEIFELSFKIDSNEINIEDVNIIKLIKYVSSSKNLYQKCINEEKVINYGDHKILNDFFYGIALNYSVYGLDNNILGNWIQQLFHKNDGYQTPLVINPYREDGNYFASKEIELSIDRVITNIYSSKEFTGYVSSDYFLDKVIHEFKSNLGHISVNGNFADILNKAFVGENGQNTQEIDNEFDFIPMDSPDKFSAIDAISFFCNNNYYIKHSYRIIGQLDGNFFNYKDFFNFAISINDNQKQVINLFTAILELKSSDFQTNFEDKDESKLAVINENIYYIIYKIYKIGIVYSHIFDGIYDDKFKLNTEYILEKIFTDKSHITLKLRRSVLFLNQFNSISNSVTFSAKGKFKDNTDYSIDVFDGSSLTDYYLGLKDEELNKLVFVDKLTLLPPPVYHQNFTLVKYLTKEDKSVVSIRDLSSGELQMILSTHCILYHLKNINSVQNTNVSNNSSNIIKYRNILIILDEIELYFHPEYQRKFVNEVRELINNHSNTLEDIDCIQFLLSTHSPFILSDIPSQNILKLKDGKPVPDKNGKNSFAANIHDLLNDEFFLENGTMGAFAESKIKELIHFYHRVSLLDFEPDLEKKKEKENNLLKDYENKKAVFEFLVNNVGEPVYQSVLESNFNVIQLKMEFIKKELGYEKN